MVGSYQRVSVPRVITEKYITLLHRRYKKAQRIYDRALWQVLHASCVAYKSVN
jgi:hypothetical protein